MIIKESFVITKCVVILRFYVDKGGRGSASKYKWNASLKNLRVMDMVISWLKQLKLVIDLGEGIRRLIDWDYRVLRLKKVSPLLFLMKVYFPMTIN